MFNSRAIRMSSQSEKADLLKKLHHSGKMLVLPNIWDAAGAVLLENLGDPAVATASAAIARAHGYDDGERIPFDLLLAIVTQIVKSVDVPVTVDIEHGQVSVELGRLEILHRLLPQEGIDETSRRRRATMAPLVRSTFTYAVAFATVVLILATLGFNPVPFLAGAGILGLVVGFGAQSLINDVVSGFFILFENTYLVGDVVEAAGAKGVVEAIEFRTTKIRDAEGRLYGPSSRFVAAFWPA